MRPLPITDHKPIQAGVSGIEKMKGVKDGVSPSISGVGGGGFDVATKAKKSQNGNRHNKQSVRRPTVQGNSAKRPRAKGNGVSKTFKTKTGRTIHIVNGKFAKAGK